jgi:hypothetical protein
MSELKGLLACPRLSRRAMFKEAIWAEQSPGKIALVLSVGRADQISVKIHMIMNIGLFTCSSRAEDSERGQRKETHGH